MMPRMPLIPIVVVVTVISTCMQAFAATPVIVQLASGRTASGVIDARSNDAQLWLRRGDQSASIVRPLDWQTVVSAQRDGIAISIDDLKTLAKEASAESPVVIPPDIVQPKWRGVFAHASKPATDDAPLPQVRTLAIDAMATNWDSDIETDGLVVVAYPLDVNGQIVPVTGTLEVELIAPEVRRFQDAPNGRGLTLERIAQWTSAVHAEDFTSRGARVELPFQALHPEFDTKILPQGLVHARLVVPGQGTFDTSVELIRVRPWSPLRDKYWRDTGRRFFPNEQTGRAKRAD